MTKELEMKEKPDLKIDAEKKEPKRFRKTKKFFLFLLILLCARLVYFYSLDKPLRTNVDAVKIVEPDSDLPDAPFADNYNARQEREVLPAEENGWREILQALGPKCLERRAIAEQVPWNEIATNDLSKDWYKNEWVPLCEKFKLDPDVKPAAYDRLSLTNFTIKNGIVGDEPQVEEGDGFEYWENGEKKFGRATRSAAGDLYIKLMGTPWTAEEYPVAAKWLKENEDLYNLVANAVRKPKFCSWRFMPDQPINLMLSDSQYQRELARLFQIRIRNRVALGDVSGVLDDVETMLRMAEATFNRENAVVMEELVGIAISGIAFGSPYAGATDAKPTPEECRRAKALAAKFASDELRNSLRQNYMRAEKASALNAVAAYLRTRRTLGVPCAVFDEAFVRIPNEDVWWEKALRHTHPLWATPFNDKKALRAFNDAWNECADAEPDQREKIFIGDESSDLARIWKVVSASDAEFGRILAKLVMPSFNACDRAIDRIGCVAKTHVINDALLEYQATNGTLPPTYSVDANGDPLFSWRVLILPYLGEEEKALFEKLALDEPWNSEHNKPLLAVAPEVFRCPSRNFDDPAQTCFAVLVGNDAFFDASGKGKDLNAFKREGDVDPLARALLVERDAPAHWAAPDSNLSLDQLRARFDAGKPLGGDGFLSHVHTTGSQTARANGAVRFNCTDTRAVEYDEEALVLLNGFVPKSDEELSPDESAVSEEPQEQAEKPADSETSDDATDVDDTTQDASTPDSLSAE